MMHPPQGLGASIPPTVPLLSTAALLGSASTLSEPYYQYSRFGKKPDTIEEQQLSEVSSHQNVNLMRRGAPYEENGYNVTRSD
ncbi:uncharacterized protein LOC105075346 isoform X2 [Camelus bactrianus]|uniref:Uncharacterized protein LOC105075346 isoform X2 n=1 Tax=Camelus bactrianus TaxID=9837 RepID=A0AC58R779_CAMBA